MGMSSTALFGSRLQGQECKRVTAARDLRYTSVWLALSSLTYTAHSLFLHIDNTLRRVLRRYRRVRVARLQSEFCTKDFFRATNFLTKNAPKFSPEIFERLFCGSEKNPGKFPPNFPLNFPNFPAKNQKKFTNELLQERRKKEGLSRPLSRRF